ncbi:MAG: hypothetical protein KIS95_13730 [Anaerolineae bacterium]|uniref:hypothetical protein n=1 Tax=Promineifilum sp. TaxID=2664178 RepID=UPI001DA98FC8|nr:hypothetical protein [Anaerolineales bacterium]MCB8936316.1 hypothetical protein [Promineifilum sp.]MCO5180167.1 hypothetical protein [Promineifilum sp.]MCW5848291.1 hypothetical protein [Anaerolineae bacterium]
MTRRLSRSAFERAARFMREEARPLEHALFAFYFEGGRRTGVLAALVPFQNPDGGFGHGLEPDMRSPASSVIATVTALDILRGVGADEDTPGLPAALAYLVGAYDVETERWPIVPPEVEDAPHAPWWSYADSVETYRSFWANPRAAVVGYLQQFNRLAPSPFKEGARHAVVNDLMRYPQHMEMHDLLCFVDLLETDGLPREHYEGILDKLRRALPQSVSTTAEEWDDYGLQPIQVVRSPESPLHGVIDPAVIDANLDHLINRQQPDGSWRPNWSWDFVDAAAWAVAEREWRGVLTLRALRTLQAYDRIDTV